MEQQLSGKIALVTGAGKGIGRATAKTLAKAGATVVATARTPADLQRLADEITSTGGSVLTMVGDLTSDDFVEALFAEVATRFARLDILVNNAGMAPFASVEDADARRLRECLELNIVAVFQCTQQAVRMMKAQGTGGKIITIGSVRSRWTENGDCGFYNASKYGVYGLMESIARQLQGDGSHIAVGMVNPGIVDTPLTNPGGEPRPNWLVAENIANAVLHAVSAPGSVNVFETVVFSTSQSPW